MSAALFPVEPSPPTPTPGQRRRTRQTVAVAHGQHPLAVALRMNIPLHADAAPIDDRTAPGLRCGTCAHRRQFGGHARAYAKCTAGRETPGRGRRYPRHTNGIGTDVAAWWPACADHATA
ncbi:hypothetical protein [Actinokineospora sp.]|uniref:hypothetical protein n=1 Tax=Actinokineospora sp. TaxID=1872133 RepID=UPI003D6A6930